MEFPMRINKYLAHTGVASRRESDTLITEGKVIINGAKAQMGQQVTEEDKVTIKGKTKAKSYLAYYKGRGIMSYPLKPAASPELVATVSQQLRGCLRRDQRLLTVC